MPQHTNQELNLGGRVNRLILKNVFSTFNVKYNYR